MTKKLSMTAQWMLDHPTDTPPPKDPSAARAWRRKRFEGPKANAERAKYEQIMAEQHRRPVVYDLGVWPF